MKACSKKHYVLFEGVSVRALDEATLVLVETAGSVLLSVGHEGKLISLSVEKLPSSAWEGINIVTLTV